MNINDTIRYLNVGLPEDILRYKMIGDFKNAIRLIDLRTADPTVDEDLKACMTAQREMMLHITKDFPYSRSEALAIIHEHIPDFTDKEFDDRVDLGTIRWIFVNGEPRYFKRFFQTLVKTEPEFAKRANKIPSTKAAQSQGENPLDRCISIMKKNGSMPCRIRIRATLKADDDKFVPGGNVLAHIPVPAACRDQSDIVIESIYPEDGVIAPENAEQRTVYWNGSYTGNPEFSVVYSYKYNAVYHDDSYTGPVDKNASDYLSQIEPHLVFTPYLKNLTAAVTAGISDPYEKARAIYDYITLNMKYTYMPEYFVLESIAENCARSRTGDCGVFALLFITMCRIAGIPARWQSGLSAEPDDVGCHDWAEFYTEPRGWLLADTSYGISSHRVGNEERRRFYFGNLEPYRMVANREFQAPFTLDKQGWRADPYDNQLGEIEINGVGLNFTEYETDQVMLSFEEL